MVISFDLVMTRVQCVLTGKFWNEMENVFDYIVHIDFKDSAIFKSFKNMFLITFTSPNAIKI